MLPHYSALKVAEQFRVLEALAPGRIDLGVGRAPGGDMRTARALNPNAAHAAEEFPIQVRDLQAWTSVGRHAGITAHPIGPHAPEIWILGSSDYGAQLAAHFGLPYAFAYFFTDGVGAEQAMALYRRLYSRASAIPSRKRRCASGRSPRRATRKRRTTRSRATAGASTARAECSGRCSLLRRSPRAASTLARSRASRRCARAASSARSRRCASGSFASSMRSSSTSS
jgi:luciferase family oxidoreductase group 1